MSIELPRPNNEASTTHPSLPESPTAYSRAETAQPGYTVENKSTEAPSFQEVKTGQGAGDGFVAHPQTSVTTTTYNDPSHQVQLASVSLDDVPAVAADEDLIEKQWVESVKRIVRDTRNDPFRQSEAISLLQADYLQKRYGKTIGQADVQ